MTHRENTLDEVLKVIVYDDMAMLWCQAITTWAHSQRSRRIALRCQRHEELALTIIINNYDSGYREVTHEG